jgi:hypothetical protein
MKRPLAGWIVLWSGLLLSAASGRHALAHFAASPELAALHGGDPAPDDTAFAPAPVPRPPPGNGQCATLGCDCANFPNPGCWWDNNTNSCKICTNPVGATTQYLCCVNRNLAGKNCQPSLNTAQCGALTSTAANNPPFGAGPPPCAGGNPCGPCLNNNGAGICVNATGMDPACKTYQTVDQAKSDGCP